MEHNQSNTITNNNEKRNNEIDHSKKNNKSSANKLVLIVVALAIVVVVCSQLRLDLSGYYYYQQFSQEVVVNLSLLSTIKDNNNNDDDYYSNELSHSQQEELQQAISSCSKKKNNNNNNKTRRRRRRRTNQQQEQSQSQHYHNNNLTTILPNILLIGAQKAGTTALAKTLFDKYNVCHGAIFEGDLNFYKKEVNFFNRPQRFQQGVEFYSKRFQHCYQDNKYTTTTTTTGQPLIMDATPEYMDSSIAEKVYKTYNSVGLVEKLKIIAIVREPVSRDLSLYNHNIGMFLHKCKYYAPVVEMKQRGENNNNNNNGTGDGDVRIMSFAQYLEKTTFPKLKNNRGIHYSLYAKQLKPWFETFDRNNNILILSYDEFVHDPTNFLHRVLKFLGLQQQQQDTITIIDNHNNDNNNPIEKINTQQSSLKVLKPKCSDQSRLAALYMERNDALYNLLESKPGPPMEQRPFPKFQLGECFKE